MVLLRHRISVIAWLASTLMLGGIAEGRPLPRGLTGWTVMDYVTVTADSGTSFDLSTSRKITLSNGHVYSTMSIALPILPFSDGVLFGKDYSARELVSAGQPALAQRFPKGITLLKLVLDGEDLDLIQLR